MELAETKNKVLMNLPQVELINLSLFCMTSNIKKLGAIENDIKSEKESSCNPIFEELFVSLATNPSKKSKIQAININRNAIK